MGNTRPGSIISQHDRGNRYQTVTAPRIVLRRLRHQGYHFQAPLPLPPPPPLFTC